jgi:hypothetical protein
MLVPDSLDYLPMNQPAAVTARSILRIGPFTDDSACAIELQAAILDHAKKLKAAAEEEPLESSDGHAGQEQQDRATTANDVYLSNKYFTAIISLQDLQHRAPASAPSTDRGTEDGVILVFDEYLSNLETAAAASPALSSFNAVASLFETILQDEDRPTSPGDMLRLCVGVSLESTSTTASTASEAEYSRRVLWCLDHGFEYVMAEISPDAVQRGHDTRDKEGFARIMEAIHGTIWSSAVMNNNKNYRSMAQLVEATTSSTTSTRKPTTAEHTKKGASIPASMELTAHANGGPDVAPVPQDPPDAADTFDETIQQAKRIREVSQTTDLSDDARRKRAGDAAKLVLTMMNEMGIDDDDDDNEEVDSQQDGECESED